MQGVLSVAIAAHNEEIHIRECIASVYSWVDEIILIDGSSNDNTVKYARAFGKKVRVISASNPPMFHKNKQKALINTTSRWVLQLDADEVVSVDLKNEIMRVIAQNGTGAYWLPRLNHFLGRALKKGGQYPDYTIRLYKNGVAHFACKSIHEQVTIKKGVDVGCLKQPLLHYPYDTFSTYVHKWSAYCSLEASYLFAQKQNLGFCMFMSYFFVKPTTWFFKTYIRHLGFVDGFAGFVFSLFSALRFWVVYTQLYELYDANNA